MSDSKKPWVTITVALISLAGVIFVAVWNTYQASDEEIGFVVKEINDTLIPDLEKENLELRKQIMQIRERIAILESKTGKLPKPSDFEPRIPIHRKPISKIRVQQTAPMPPPGE